MITTTHRQGLSSRAMDRPGNQLQSVRFDIPARQLSLSIPPMAKNPKARMSVFDDVHDLRCAMHPYIVAGLEFGRHAVLPSQSQNSDNFVLHPRQQNKREIRFIFFRSCTTAASVSPGHRMGQRSANAQSFVDSSEQQEPQP